MKKIKKEKSKDEGMSSSKTKLYSYTCVHMTLEPSSIPHRPFPSTHGTLREIDHKTRQETHSITLPPEQQHRLSFPTIKQLKTPNRKITFENL